MGNQPLSDCGCHGAWIAVIVFAILVICSFGGIMIMNHVPNPELDDEQI